MNAPEFAAWLEPRYRPSTQAKSLGEVGAASQAFYETGALPVLGANLHSVRRYVAFLHETGTASAFDEAILESGLSAPRPRSVAPAGRKNLQRSFDDDDWRRLSQVIGEDYTPMGCVLTVLMASPRRIGEILPLKHRAIRAGLDAGVIVMVTKGGYELQVPVQGAHEAWGKLCTRMEADGHRGDVATWVSPYGAGSSLAGGDAYQKCNRYLRQLGQETGVAGRVHLHRMRRTVAVQALRVTKDVTLVQGLLGHRNLQSTTRYLDELRLDELGALQEELAQFRG